MDHASTLTAKSLDLFIGRRRTRIKEPARFEVNTDMDERVYGDLPAHIPISRSYRLFIGDKLFASVRVFPKRRYSRAPIRFVKPKRGPLQIHFVKKYVTLH